MSQTTSNDSAVKSTTISSDVEERLTATFKTLHHLVSTHMVSAGAKLTFMSEFEKCGMEDYKEVAHAARKLLGAKRQEKWENRIKGIRAGIQGVVDTYMNRKRAAKAQFDALPEELRAEGVTFNPNVSIPVKELVGCFPQGATQEQILRDLKDLSYNVIQNAEKAYLIRVAFVADKVADEAPKSEKTAKAA
jgi:hypothetical protein